MIICLACGNCTENNNCEVCGMQLIESKPEETGTLQEKNINGKQSSTENNCESVFLQT